MNVESGAFKDPELERNLTLQPEYQGLLKLRDEKVLKDKQTAYWQIANFGQLLRNKFPDDCQEYLYFHILTGSTPPDGVNYKIDFPGEYSVEKFIKEELLTNGENV